MASTRPERRRHGHRDWRWPLVALAGAGESTKVELLVVAVGFPLLLPPPHRWSGGRSRPRPIVRDCTARRAPAPRAWAHGRRGRPGGLGRRDCSTRADRHRSARQGSVRRRRRAPDRRGRRQGRLLRVGDLARSTEATRMSESTKHLQLNYYVKIPLNVFQTPLFCMLKNMALADHKFDRTALAIWRPA